MQLRARRRAGLTVLELLLVVSILAVLAAVGAPVLWKEAARSKRTEAIHGLSAIRDFQVAYLLEHGQYGDTFDEIGFELDGGTRVDERTVTGRYYTFTVRALPLNGNDRGNFQALATADLDPDDATLDILMIENALIVHDD